jgi:hypothetical protein
MSSGLHVQRPEDFRDIAMVPAVQPPPGEGQSAEIWHELIYEMATVRALTAAALDARSEESRLALLTLLDAEAAEVSALLGRVGHAIEPDHWTAPRAS